MNRKLYILALFVIYCWIDPAISTSLPTPKTTAASKTFVLEEATIASVHQAIQEKQLTCERLVNAYLDRIRLHNFNTYQSAPINALAEINPYVMEEAQRIDKEYAKNKQLIGSLHCIPVVLKDNIDSYDTTTSVGSFALLGNQPVKDAFLIDKLRKAGAIIIAKAGMDEFAWGMLGINSRNGRMGNAYDPNNNTGGSSGGSAAAVSANFALLGIGTDNSGSVRIPAAFNGIIGLRPTMGLISQRGIFPLGNLDATAGPMARTVTDLAALLDIIVTQDPADKKMVNFTRPKSYMDYLESDGLQGKRIGIVKQVGNIETLKDMPVGLQKVLSAAYQEMQKQGATLVEDIILDRFINDREFNQAGEIQEVNEYLHSFPGSRRDFNEICRSERTSLFGNPEHCLYFVKNVPTSDSKQYAKVLKNFQKNKTYVENVMKELSLDAILMPISRQGIASYDELAVNTWRAPLASNAGLPAIAITVGYGPKNLPIGIELIGKSYAEGELIAMAYAFEQTTPRIPPQLAKVAAADPSVAALADKSIAQLNHLITLIGQETFESVLKKGHPTNLSPEQFRKIVQEKIQAMNKTP